MLNVWTAGGLFIVAATSYYYYYYVYRRRDLAPRVLAGRVSGLTLYPIKGCGQLHVAEAECTDIGLRYSQLQDRSWALVCPNGEPLITKHCPRLVTIEPKLFDDEYFLVEAPGMTPLKIPYESQNLKNTMEFQHEQRTERGIISSDEINDWFATYTETEGLKLVQAIGGSDSLSVSGHKLVPSDNFGAKKSDKIMYAYASPYLVCNQGSLDDLNANLPEDVDPVKIGNFRPNILISGPPAWDEDNWADIYINDIHLKMMTPCFRCLVTTVDADTGVMNPKSQPLKTLMKMRMLEKSERQKYGPDSSSPMFGIYVLVRGSGHIRIGDEVHVKRRL